VLSPSKGSRKLMELEMFSQGKYSL